MYVDGGIRRGTDVLKALALGADAAFAARAFAFALAVDGEDGVGHALSLLRDEIALEAGLLGCTSPGGRYAGTRAANVRREVGRLSGDVRAELLLADGFRAAAPRPQVGHDPARRQVGQVQEGDGRARAVRRALQPARARLRRGDRQGRGEERSASCRRARSSTTTPRSAAPTRWRHFLGQLYNREVGVDDLVTVIRFSQIMSGPVVPGSSKATSSNAAQRFQGRSSHEAGWPSSHFGNGAYATLGVSVSSSTPAPCESARSLRS